MKTYLINPPSPFLLDDKSNMPLGLMYVHSYLQAKGVDAEIVDLAGLKEEDWEIPYDVYSGAPTIYGITASTPQFPLAQKIAERIKTKYAHSITVIGGTHATCDPLIDLTWFDMLVSGEGEKAMHFLSTGDGKFPSEKEKEKDIDKFPHPRLESIDHESYHCGVFTTEDGQAIKGAPIITARGCTHNCAFCCSPSIYDRKIRFHSPVYISDWVHHLREYGYEALYVVDDTLMLGINRLRSVCQVFIDHDMLWRCCARGDATTGEKLEMMHYAGCRQIDIGVESGSQRLLDLINKGERVEDNARAIQLAHEVGIKVKACIIVGLPTETQEDIDMTKRFIEENEPDSVTLCTFIPFPGCDIERQPQKYGYELPEDDYSRYVCCGAQGEEGAANPTVEDHRRQLMEVIGERATRAALKKRRQA